ncbi:hypothetical protein [Streptomyces fagopyri]|uniref:hypothetical protein n=1 Tax=Streptomyces fagopyri TaxID=2662397 RepID=UPI003805C95D
MDLAMSGVENDLREADVRCNTHDCDFPKIDQQPLEKNPTPAPSVLMSAGNRAIAVNSLPPRSQGSAAQDLSLDAPGIGHSTVYPVCGVAAVVAEGLDRVRHDRRPCPPSAEVDHPYPSRPAVAVGRIGRPSRGWPGSSGP